MNWLGRPRNHLGAEVDDTALPSTFHLPAMGAQIHLKHPPSDAETPSALLDEPHIVRGEE